MTDDSEAASPAARADRHRLEFIEVIEANEDAGEPVNILLSQEIRESLESFLRQSAAVVIEADNGPLIGEMVINTAADELPHLTKGCAREALSAYVKEQEQSERLGTQPIGGGENEPSRN